MPLPLDTETEMLSFIAYGLDGKPLYTGSRPISQLHELVSFYGKGHPRVSRLHVGFYKLQKTSEIEMPNDRRADAVAHWEANRHRWE